jgi:hypothetical protein
MKATLSYLGHSTVAATSGGGAQVKLAPNLSRGKTFFDATLKDPIRFREAISALHAVVIGDGRFVKRDKSAYLEWQAQQQLEDAAFHKAVEDQTRREELERFAKEPPPQNLDADFRKMHRTYWNARRAWANQLARNDPALFRALVPCDPVVTVAPDTVLFECFSKDESAYGCLTVERNSFAGHQDAALGTTNVDYSQALYDHFQTLRTYKPTRLTVDPSGFDVKVEGQSDHREEKIDLPPSWLRGFGQLQAAMALPATKLTLLPETVYGILAYLRRHREKTGPRSIRFLLVPGKAPTITLEPWGVTVPSFGPPFQGPRELDIKVWGRRRLLALARVLPLATTFDVTLLGTGLPSIWTARLGDMQFTLGLSGWTTNDWTHAAALEFLTSSTPVSVPLVEKLSAHLEEKRMGNVTELATAMGATQDALQAALVRLAQQGQLVADPAHGVVRWRPLMATALSDAVLGPEPEEVREGRAIWRAGKVTITQEAMVTGRRVLAGKADNTSCELLLDSDGVLKKAKCSCKVFHKQGLRAGPCRHLLALRLAGEQGAAQKGGPAMIH